MNARLYLNAPTLRTYRSAMKKCKGFVIRVSEDNPTDKVMKIIDASVVTQLRCVPTLAALTSKLKVSKHAS